jgi:UV excision repair protein RAD23
MNSKIKPKNMNQSSNTTSSQLKTEEKKEVKKEEKKEENKKQTEKIMQKSNEEKYTQQLNSLVDMGFEKSQAEAAIKAARGQIDLAIEYLYNGIPEKINNNFQQMQEQGQQEGEVGEENNEDDPLKNVASIAKIIGQRNPSALTQLLQSIQQNDPDLMNLIKEREEEFKTLLEQPITDQDYRAIQRFQQEMGLAGIGVRLPGQGSMSGQRQIRLDLTPQDREAINRLKDLGNFSETEVIQAYIACEKNEELTANYLFEQKLREEEEASRNNNNQNQGQGQGQ